MNTSATESVTRAVRVEVGDEALTVVLEDGRTVTVPLGWYPRLLYGTRPQRSCWRLIGRGEGIHWPDLDEDISVEGLILGRKSQESQESFTKWMRGRPRRVPARAVAEERPEYRIAPRQAVKRRRT